MMVSLQGIAASLVVPWLMVGLASNAEAAPHKKRVDAGVARQAAMPVRSLATNGESGYYEHIRQGVVWLAALVARL
jgi:hypothetical protein